jgi:hypothetical protein
MDAGVALQVQVPSTVPNTGKVATAATPSDHRPAGVDPDGVGTVTGPVS